MEFEAIICVRGMRMAGSSVKRTYSWNSDDKQHNSNWFHPVTSKRYGQVEVRVDSEHIKLKDGLSSSRCLSLFTRKYSKTIIESGVHANSWIFLQGTYALTQHKLF